VKLDRVNALTLRIEALQYGCESIGEPAMLGKGACAQFGPGSFEVCDCPGGAFSLHSFLQRHVAGEQVVVRQRRGLIENFMSAGSVFHAPNLAPGAWAVLDSASMHSYSRISSNSGAALCPGSLALLLLLRR
jgi:hypothetical protein